jgi:N-acetylmuramoyl-L-alanine amidase/FlgD Ig-like domain
MCPGFPFTAVGLLWHQSAGNDLRARIRTSDTHAAFGAAATVSSEPDEGPSPGSPDYHPGQRAAGLLWTGTKRCVRLSLEVPGGVVMSDIRAAFVNTSGTSGGLPRVAKVDPSPDSTVGSVEIAATTQAEASTPTIVGRAEWGASPRFFNTGTPGCRAPYYSPSVKVAYVHHTAGSNSYSASQSDDVVRAIYWFHTQERGFCDIAYNFLLSKYGQIFEGRAGGVYQPVTPGSQAGFNPNTFSVSAMGNFQTATPSRTMLSALRRLLAWRLDVAHVPALGHDTLVSQGGATTRYPAGTKVSMPTIVGHRVTGLTACPGYHLFARIPAIRRAVASMGLPKIVRPEQSRVRLRAGVDSVRMSAAATADLTWTVSIRNRSGAVVRTLEDRGQSLSVAWNGHDDGGGSVPAGKYRAVLAGRDAAGRAARPAMVPLEVLTASGSPALSVAAFPRVTSVAPAVGTASKGRGFRILKGISAAGPGDVWAVGGAMTGPARGHPLVLHRSSSGWSQILAPNPDSVSGFLAAVDAPSPGDAWAVGYRCGRPSCASGGFGERTLIEHAEGGTWRVVPSPNPDTGGDRLNAVAAISPTDVWAVGDAFDEGLYLHQPLVLHWDGARWASVSAPRIEGQDVNMTGLLALSATDLWAVGHGCPGGRGCGGSPAARPVVLRYDGARWSVVRTVSLTAAAASLQDITGNAASDLTAVGWLARTRHGNSEPFVERRRRGEWHVGPAPQAGGSLFAIDSASRGPVWTVGDRRVKDGFRTLAARRTPDGWKVVPSPSPAGRMSFLSSLAFLSREDAWATGPSIGGAFLLHWNGKRWGLVRPG